MVKSRLTSPPKSISTNTAIRVVAEVISVRLRHSLMLWLTVPSKPCRRAVCRFSRMRSKTTNGVVERVADNGQQGSDHREGNLNGEEREQPEGDEHIVEERDDRGDPVEEAVEAPSHVDQNQRQCHQDCAATAALLNSLPIFGPTFSWRRIHLHLRDVVGKSGLENSHNARRLPQYLPRSR